VALGEQSLELREYDGRKGQLVVNTGADGLRATGDARETAPAKSVV
jgi:hypothetical protein